MVEFNAGIILRKWSERTPDKAVIIYDDKPITYKEMNEGANHFAHYLQKKGLKKGERVACLLYNCPEFLEVYYAAAKLGLVFVPLNYRLTPSELEYQLNDSGTRLVMFDEQLAGAIAPLRFKTKVEKDKFIWVKSNLPASPGCPEWAEDYHEVVKNCSAAEPLPELPVYMDDDLCIMYTSGVTGFPKGAVLTHQQTYFKSFQNVLYTDMRSEDIYLAQLPLFHSGGLFVVANPIFCRGATLVLRRRFIPQQFAEDIQKYKTTIVFALTTMWRFILQTGKLEEVNLNSVRCALIGGERTEEELFRKLLSKGLRLLVVFGQTENSAMMMLPEKDIERKMGSIGLPGFFSEIWIADEQGKELAPGEIGEIVARGPLVMKGYWNKPEETAKAIVNGILHTGDLGYRDEEGYFYIVDRAKDMYRSGGENVYPAEIEKILLTHPKISDVVIIGVPDEKWGETGKAFIVLKNGETITIEEVKDFLQGKIARYKFPTRLELLDALPMTSSGKIRKVELKERERRKRMPEERLLLFSKTNKK